jgi:hypothetical protein
MTLQLKNVLTVLVTAAVGLFSGWFVSAKYANEGTWWIWLVLGMLSLLIQVRRAFVKTKEENLFELSNDLTLQKARQKLGEAKAIGEIIEKEIGAGNLKKATDWMKIRDGL